MPNADAETVRGFGEEWVRFPQENLSRSEHHEIFDSYFGIFPWEELPGTGARGADFGCGSGRWALLVAPRVGHLVLVDASEQALDVARRNTSKLANVSFLNASLDEAPLERGSLDFAYSLGVLHHMPNTEEGMRAIARSLKPGAPFLVYLYYKFDNRPAWYRHLWQATDVARRVVARLTPTLRFAVADAIAASVYWPLARGAMLAQERGINPSGWPLSAYRDKSFTTMRTDALDRFGTRLEQRFTKDEIRVMLERTGYERIQFAERVPYWVAVARRSTKEV